MIFVKKSTLGRPMVDWFGDYGWFSVVRQIVDFSDVEKSTKICPWGVQGAQNKNTAVARWYPFLVQVPPERAPGAYYRQIKTGI